MDDDDKRKVILVIGCVCILIFLYSLFVGGAGYGCSSGGGVLLKDISGVRCVDLDSVDLCRDYTGRVITKPDNLFNASFNMSYGG